MAHKNAKSQWLYLFFGITILAAMTMDLVDCQYTFTDEGDKRYVTKQLYTVMLSIEPSAIQIIADPRFSSAYFPMYDMVYMSESPTSQIRRLPQVMNSLQTPESWPYETDIVTDHTTIANPNRVGVLPNGTFDNQPPYVLWVASGFYDTKSGLTSNMGGIFLINLSANRWMPVPLVNRTGKGFTHVEWIDMDIDGYLDCVTIEGSDSMNSLVWLQQPAGQTRWIQHRISDEQDNVGGTQFRVMKLPSKITGSVSTVFIVAGRTTGNLTAYWVEDADNDWTRVKKIRSLVIATDGSYVGLEIVDLNMDGRPDILTSTSASAENNGTVIAYEYPKYGFDSGGKWRKHLLSQWQKAATSYTKTTPGPVFSFTIMPSVTGRTQQKPHILVLRQDAGKVYILSPDIWSPYIWDYTAEEIWNSSKQIGTPSVADLNGDGKIEIFIPSDYRINVLSYEKYSPPPPRKWTGRLFEFMNILYNFAAKLLSPLFKSYLKINAY